MTKLSAPSPAPKGTLVCDFSDRSKHPVDITCYLAMILWVGWFVTLPLLIFLCYFLHRLEYKIAFGSIAGVVALSAIWPVKEEWHPAWGRRLGSWIMQKACIYFGVKLIQEDSEKLKNCGPIIIAIEPHDVLPVCIFVFSEILGYFPGQRGRGCLSSACFRIPLMKHAWSWANAQSVDRKNMDRLMKLGFSPGLCPGGATEVCYLDDPNEYVLYLRKRRGMFSMAMATGHAVVPVFAFGQRKAYSYFVPNITSLKEFGRKIGFIPILFFGAFNIPMFIPKAVPITVVTGSPIIIPKTPRPIKPSEGASQEEVSAYNKEQAAFDKLIDGYMDQWIAGVEHLFRTYKDQYGCEGATLKII